MDKRWLRRNSANIITCMRIAGTLVFIFLPTLSVPFLIVYGFTGATDVADGFVARKLNIVSAFGSKLDTVSDLLFYVSMMFKILPYLQEYLPGFIMTTIYILFGYRMIIYLLVWMYRRVIMASHSYFNKATGIMVFFVPFLIKTSIFPYYGGAACLLAILGALHDTKMLIETRPERI